MRVILAVVGVMFGLWVFVGVIQGLLNDKPIVQCIWSLEDDCGPTPRRRR